jgi:hypothetical protein
MAMTADQIRFHPALEQCVRGQEQVLGREPADVTDLCAPAELVDGSMLRWRNISATKPIKGGRAACRARPRGCRVSRHRQPQHQLGLSRGDVEA